MSCPPNHSVSSIPLKQSNVIKLSQHLSSNRLGSHSSIDLLLILVKDGGALDVAIFKDVDVGGGELAGADFLLEEEIELGEGAAAGLGEAEVGVYNAEEAGAAPEEASVIAPVCKVRMSTWKVW